MGNRLTRIYTRTGDRGDTGLAGGARVPKDGARIEAIGAVDELNSQLGMLLSAALDGDLEQLLLGVQHRLFDLGGELSMPGTELLQPPAVAVLETALDALNGSLPPLQEFILPGGGEASARCHVARSVCRRAERRLVTLAQTEAVNAHALAYLNRLSDLLFVLARTLAKRSDRPETYWQSDRP